MHAGILAGAVLLLGASAASRADFGCQFHPSPDALAPHGLVVAADRQLVFQALPTSNVIRVTRMQADPPGDFSRGVAEFVHEADVSSVANPRWIRAANLDGDADALDLVVQSENGEFAVHLFDHLGETIGPAQSIVTIAPPTYLPGVFELGDVTGDGAPDIVVPAHSFPAGAGVLLVLVNNGDGSFHPTPVETVCTTGNPPIQMYHAATLRADGDATDDVVISGENASLGLVPGNARVYHGQPDGSLVAGADIPIPPGDLVAIASGADVNGSGGHDIVAYGGIPAQMFIIPGNGDGTFEPQQAVSVPGGSEQVLDVRFQRAGADATRDIVLLRTDSVLYNETDQFGEFPQWRAITTIRSPADAHFADLSADGVTDTLLYSGSPEAGLGVVWSDFSDPDSPWAHERREPVAPFTEAGRDRPIRVGKFIPTAPDQPAILLAVGDSLQQRALISATPAPFDTTVIDTYTFSAGVRGIDATPVGHAGLGFERLTFVATTYDGANARIEGDFQGGATSPIVLENAGLSNFVGDIRIADFNADGFDDYAYANINDVVSVRLNNADGTFSPATISGATATPTAPGSWIDSAVAVADFDGNSLPDLAGFAGDTGAVTVAFNNGDDTFSFASPLSPGDPGARLHDVAAADVNADDRIDVIASTSPTGCVAVFLNQGAGQFAAPILLPAGPDPEGLAIADTNSDGDAEIIVTSAPSSETVARTVRVLELEVTPASRSGAVPSISLGAQRLFSVGCQPMSVAAAPLREQRGPDLVVAGNDADGALAHAGLSFVPSIADPPPAGCDGDADGNGAVEITDISFIIFRLGDTGPPGSLEGDVDSDGSVSSTDITYVIFRLGTCNPPAR